MLYRKFARRLEDFLNNEPRKILLVNGARQIGKSYIIRYVGKQLFKNFVEINLKADKEGMGIFQSVRSVDDFYLQLGAIAGDKLGNKQDTIVFLDDTELSSLDDHVEISERRRQISLHCEWLGTWCRSCADSIRTYRQYSYRADVSFGF